MFYEIERKRQAKAEYQIEAAGGVTLPDGTIDMSNSGDAVEWATRKRIDAAYRIAEKFLKRDDVVSVWIYKKDIEDGETIDQYCKYNDKEGWVNCNF